MSRLFAASELAGLPGLPTSTRGVSRRAHEEKWPREKRLGRGGETWVYPVTCLPMETQVAILALREPSARREFLDGVERALDDTTRRIAELKRLKRQLTKTLVALLDIEGSAK